MGDFVVTGSTGFPLELLSSIVCSVAIAIYVLAQPAGNSDDDDSNNGGGGLMQPAVSAAGAS